MNVLLVLSFVYATALALSMVEGNPSNCMTMANLPVLSKCSFDEGKGVPHPPRHVFRDTRFERYSHTIYLFSNGTGKTYVINGCYEKRSTLKKYLIRVTVHAGTASWTIGLV